VVRASDLRSWVRFPAGPLSSNNSRQVVHTHVPLSPSSIIWYRPRNGDALRLGWEGNRRSGVAPAMRHRRCALSTYRLNGLGKGDEHPPTLQWGIAPFTFYTFLPSLAVISMLYAFLCISIIFFVISNNFH